MTAPDTRVDPQACVICGGPVVGIRRTCGPACLSQRLAERGNDGKPRATGHGKGHGRKDFGRNAKVPVLVVELHACSCGVRLMARDAAGHVTRNPGHVVASEVEPVQQRTPREVLTHSYPVMFGRAVSK